NRMPELDHADPSCENRLKISPAARLPRSTLPNEPRAHRAWRRAGLAVTIVQGVLVDELENVGPFVVGSHHQPAARGEGAPQWLLLVSGRIRAFQTPHKGVALLLRYDKSGKPTPSPFDF